MTTTTYHVVPAQHGYMLAEAIHHEDGKIELDHLPVIAWIVTLNVEHNAPDAMAHVSAITASKVACSDEQQIIKTPYGTWSECEVAEYTTEEAVIERLQEIERSRTERAK